MLRAFWQRLHPAPLIVTDRDFGQIRFIRIRDATRSYWEASVQFPPTGSMVEVFITADEPGPQDDQRAFFRELENRYRDLRDSLAPILARAYSDWLETAPPTDVWTVFTLASFSIPRMPGGETEWEISYECAQDIEHLFTVEMRGWNPGADVRIDG